VLGSRYCVYQQHQPSFGQELHCMACNTAKKTKAPAHNTLSKQPATASRQRMRQGVAVPAAWHTCTALQTATAEPLLRQQLLEHHHWRLAIQGVAKPAAHTTAVIGPTQRDNQGYGSSPAHSSP
jgi:hypothetical protein